MKGFWVYGFRDLRLRVKGLGFRGLGIQGNILRRHIHGNALLIRVVPGGPCVAITCFYMYS